MLGQRTEFSKTYLKPDGTKEKMISTEPVHFQIQENGQSIWQEIDNALIQTPGTRSLGSKEYINKANSFSLGISEDLFGQGVKLNKGNSSVNLKLVAPLFKSSSSKLPSISLNNKTITKPALEHDDKLNYKDVFKDTDVVYQSLNNGLKEEIILKKNTSQNVFSFQLNLKNLYYNEIAPGAFVFYSTETEKPVFYMPQSYMYDSLKSTEFPEGAISYDVKTEIIPNSSGYEIRLTPDSKWLSQKNRVYPVTIDPSLNVGTESGEDAFVQSGYPSSKYLAWNQAALFLGKTSYYSKGVTRTFVNFNNTDLTNARIYSAKVSAYQYNCSGVCQTSGVTARMIGNFDVYNLYWDNQPWVTDSVGHTSDNGVNKWIDIDVTTAARYWYQAGNPAGTMKGALAFTQDDESTNGQRNWKATNSGEGLGPRLYIDYNDYNTSYNVAQIPSDSKVDDLYNVGAAVYNAGRNVWRRGEVNLSYHIYKNDGSLYLYDGIKTSLPYDIYPNNSGQITAQIKLPSSPGTYVIKWDLVQEGVTWFSNQGVPTFDTTITVNDYPEYSAMYNPSSFPADMGANTTTNIPVEIYNFGRYTWSADQIKLSYHWLDRATGEYIIKNGLQSSFTSQVSSRNGRGMVNLLIKAPLNAGSYKLKIDLLQNGSTWFSDKGVPTKDYDITVTPISFSALVHLGTEDYYAKVGPVDLATGNLSYSSTDMAISSNTGLLAVSRSYNANSLDQVYSSDANGYIKNWLLNGPYKENDPAQRLSKAYINETTIHPNSYAISNGKAWARGTTDSNIVNVNKVLDSNGIIQSGYANNSVVYGHNYVYSPIQQDIKLETGSDEDMRIWLNGALLSTDNQSRFWTNNFSPELTQAMIQAALGILNGQPYNFATKTINVQLKAGWNTLMLKSSQSSGGWAFSARFTDINNNPVPNLKYSIDNQEIFGNYDTLGKGWTANFIEQLYVDDETNIYLRDSTGSVNLYTKNLDGSYKRPTGSTIDLVKNADASFTLSGKTGLKINFNRIGKLASIVDLSGNMIYYQYDLDGNCIKIIDGNRYISLVYSGKQLISVADQVGNKYSYIYDNTGGVSKLSKVIDSAGNSFSYTYNSDGKLISFSNKRSYITLVNYDSAGRVGEVRDALGNSTKFSYSSGKTSITDPLGRVSTTEFDKNSLIIASSNPKNYRQIYQYNGSYNLVAAYPDIPENDGYYFKYSYEYDTNSNLLKEIDPLGSVITYSYNGNDLSSITDQDGSTARYTYSVDGRRLLLSEQDAKSNTTAYMYDTKGNRITVTDPEGNTSKSTYSTDGDLLSATSPQLETSTFTYDQIGRKLTEKSALGKVTSYQYSNLSLLNKMTDAGGLSTSYEYDKNGNKIKEVNPNGAVKSYTYDALDRLIMLTDEIGASIQYQYDAVGNKTKTIDANGKITIYTYDELNQLTGQSEPSGGQSSVVYNKNGQPIKVIDPNNEAVDQEFDKSGNITKVSNKDGSTRYIYDKEGKVTEINSSVESENINLMYDQNNNVTKIDSSSAGGATTTYNKNDNPTTIQTPTSLTAIKYSKDGFVQQVDTKLNGQTLTTKFVRDAEGKITNIAKPNGDTTFYTYDKSNRTTQITNRNASKALLAQFSYQYDKASNITAINDGKTKITTKYGYDARNQLIKEGNKSFTYDLMGNRKTVTDNTGIAKYTYDITGDANRLLNVVYPNGQTIQFEYDKNGNVTKQIDSQNGTTGYSYDVDNYFTKAVLPNGNSIQYVYDKLLKLRTKRIETSPAGQIINATNFVYDGDRLVSETDAVGKILRSYSWDQNERLYAVSIPDNTGVLQTFTYVKNLKDDIVGLSDNNGILAAEYAYDAWGNVTTSITKAGSKILNLDKLNPRLYSSYWYDSSLGLYFMKTRMYSPTLGRFLSKDSQLSSGETLGYNPYIYCNNSPLDKIDPSGKSIWDKVCEFGSKVVQTTKNAWEHMWDAAARGLENLANSNIPIISSIARGVNRAADWTQGKWYRAAAVGLAVGVAAAAAIVAVPFIAGAVGTAATAIGAYISTSLATVSLTIGTAAVNTYNLVATRVGTQYQLYGDRLAHVADKHLAGSSGAGSKFPTGWGISEIKTAAEFVANNRAIQAIPNTFGREGFIKVGEYSGIVIKTVIRPDVISGIDKIWTAYPFK